VGIPAKTSKTGLIILLTFFEAYWLKKIAVVNPIGMHTKAEPTTIINVPKSKGKTPKDFGSRRGSHLVPNINSAIDTVLKNWNDSVNNIYTISIVVKTVKYAQRASSFSATNSL